MARPCFRIAVESVARELLEPLGFKENVDEEPGYAPFISYFRPRDKGLSEGIGIYAPGRPRAFTVELGVFPSEGTFYWAGKVGRWQEYSQRERLGRIVHPGWKGDSFRRDFLPYADHESLLAEVRRALQLALEHGPTVWDDIATRMLEARRNPPREKPKSPRLLEIRVDRETGKVIEKIYDEDP